MARDVESSRAYSRERTAFGLALWLSKKLSEVLNARMRMSAYQRNERGLRGGLAGVNLYLFF